MALHSENKDIFHTVRELHRTLFSRSHTLASVTKQHKLVPV